MGEGFRKYRVERIKPTALKIENGLDRLLKVFGLRAYKTKKAAGGVPVGAIAAAKQENHD
ncbi:MAG: hypothetical protein ABSB94_05725 [Syntrophorhabdales bacterium]|jgi:hypothetical protein